MPRLFELWGADLFCISGMSKARADRDVENVLIVPEFRSEKKTFPSIVTRGNLT